MPRTKSTTAKKSAAKKTTAKKEAVKEVAEETTTPSKLLEASFEPAAPAPAPAPTLPPPPINLTPQAVQLICNIIEVCNARGAFKPDELQMVGNLYSQLMTVLPKAPEANPPQTQ